MLRRTVQQRPTNKGEARNACMPAPDAACCPQRSLLRRLLQAMKTSVPLNSVLSRVLADHSAAELGEFRETITSMLSMAEHERRMLNSALGLMAEDVLGLWVRCYGLNGNELPNFDSRSGYTHEYTYSRYDGGGGASTVNASVPRYLPARVEVSLVQIDSKVANRLLELSGNVAGLQALVSDPAIQDAAGFVAKVQGRNDPLCKQLIPGLRTAQATVYLDNAR